jgi:hypothetical protein
MQSLDERAILKPAPRDAFVEVRTPAGRLICRYNPATHEVEIKHRHERPVVIDLKQYQQTQ